MNIPYQALKESVFGSTEKVTRHLPARRKLVSGVRSIVTRMNLVYASILLLSLWTFYSVSKIRKDHLRLYSCFGPGMSPQSMEPNLYSEWHRDSPSPVIFNEHKPLVMDLAPKSRMSMFNLDQTQATKFAVDNKERVLILTPLRDAANHLSKYFDLLTALTYPHELIDLAFLVSNSHDETLPLLSVELDRIQKGPNPFHKTTVFTKSFDDLPQVRQLKDNSDVEQRHDFEIQAMRRKAIAQARNFLLYSALDPSHSWVMWRDVDIVEAPDSIIQDLISHDTDVIVPNVWFHRYVKGKDVEGRYDYNSWIESQQALDLAATLPKDTVLVEGYKQYNTGRTYMARMGDHRANQHKEIELDGIGGVNIMVKADVHRMGINFPAYAFENQAESEGFSKMAKRAGLKVVGLPNYVIWHYDTDEKSKQR